MESISLYDPLNLRGFLQIIGDKQKKAASEAKAATIQGCLETLLYGICKTDNESKNNNIISIPESAKSKISVLDIQKLLGGGLPLSKFESFSREITDGLYDEDLNANISRFLSATPVELLEDLVSEILGKMSPRFFTYEEIASSKQAFSKKEYAGILLLCLKHGFGALYNIPFFYAERLAQEAATFDYDSPVRFALLQEAGSFGNRQAAFEYGNYIAKDFRQTDEAWSWFLKAIPLPMALWNIAYFIENGYASDAKVSEANRLLRTDEKAATISDSPALRFINDRSIHIPADNRQLESALVIYAYLGHKLQFFKAFNSVANVLQKIAVRNEYEKRRKDLIEYYYQLAVKGCCVVGLANQGAVLLKKNDKSNTEYTEQLLHEDIYLSYSMGIKQAKLSYAKEHEQTAKREGSVIQKSRELYQLYLDAYNTLIEIDKNATSKPSNRDTFKDLYYKLGLYAPDPKEKICWFEQALELHVPDSAYYVAKALYDDYRRDKSALLELFRARDILSEYLSQMTDKKDEAGMLWMVIKEILESMNEKSAAAFSL